MSDDIKAQIDFNSKKRVATLKERSARCVCKYCGGGLRVRDGLAELAQRQGLSRVSELTGAVRPW